MAWLDRSVRLVPQRVLGVIHARRFHDGSPRRMAYIQALRPDGATFSNPHNKVRFVEFPYTGADSLMRHVQQLLEFPVATGSHRWMRSYTWRRSFWAGASIESAAAALFSSRVVGGCLRACSGSGRIGVTVATPNPCPMASPHRQNRGSSDFRAVTHRQHEYRRADEMALLRLPVAVAKWWTFVTEPGSSARFEKANTRAPP